MILQGIAASGGIGIGSVILIRHVDIDYSKVQYSGKITEKTKLKNAIDSFKTTTQKMADSVEKSTSKHHADILLGQITMISDPFMLSQIEETIDGGLTAEAAVDSVCSMYADMFSGVDDEMMRQRSSDIMDIRTRLLKLLLGIPDPDLTSLPKNSIVAARDITPSITASLNKDNISALISEVGSTTSHSAILARALGIPAVLGVEGLLDILGNSMTAIVDGDNGQIITDPEGSTLSHYSKMRNEHLKSEAELKTYIKKPTNTADGKKVSLFANIGSINEAQAAIENGAEGIGLFRTEFIFMDRRTPPSENEQFNIYSSVAEIMENREVIIRTLDIGGDKDIEYLNLPKEDNPFLGYRAIRFCLDRKEIFKTQLRALLRAGTKNRKLKIMLPFITGIEELRHAKFLISQCKDELKKQNIPYNENIPVGIMIETPAAALIADALAKEADFFSIGTNDLTQYTLAVDRGNAKVQYLYSPLHPAVLISIQNIISAAKNAGIPVGMCGEAAGDKRLIPLLVHFGLDEFSVGASSILPVRKFISSLTVSKTNEISMNVMKLSDTESISNYLSGVL